jgi:hypothetical protein
LQYYAALAPAHPASGQTLWVMAVYRTSWKFHQLYANFSVQKPTKYHNDFMVDRLTNAIVNVTSGDSFQTEVSLLTREDLKQVQKKNGRLFNWKDEQQMPDKEVYKLTIVNSPSIVQGVTSLSLKADHVFLT